MQRHQMQVTLSKSPTLSSWVRLAMPGLMAALDGTPTRVPRYTEFCGRLFFRGLRGMRYGTYNVTVVPAARMKDGSPPRPRGPRQRILAVARAPYGDTAIGAPWMRWVEEEFENPYLRGELTCVNATLWRWLFGGLRRPRGKSIEFLRVTLHRVS